MNQPKQYEDIEKEYQEFAYVVSHDLHAPLRQINGFTNLLLEDLPIELSEEQQKYKEMVFRAIKEAELSLDALLEFSRLNTDEKVFVKTDPSKIISEALKKLQFQIAESKAEIEIKDMPETVTADEKKITKAFYALLDNAIKFQPEGQVPQIGLNCEETETHYIFSIRDNGIGIDPQNQERVFTILRRLHTEDSYPGRGVGLTLARKIAHIHSGDVQIDPDVTEGTTVHLSIAKNIAD